MKKIFFAIVMVIGVATVGCSQTATTQQSTSKAEINFVTSNHEFGDVPQGTPVSYVFSFKNTGKDPLVLSSVTASCGCTTPEWPKEPIKPGATASIKATFNAAGAGEFTKTVTVMSNAKTPQVILTIHGQVKPVAPAQTTTQTPAPAQTAAPKKN